MAADVDALFAATERARDDRPLHRLMTPALKPRSRGKRFRTSTSADRPDRIPVRMRRAPLRARPACERGELAERVATPSHVATPSSVWPECPPNPSSNGLVADRALARLEPSGCEGPPSTRSSGGWSHALRPRGRVELRRRRARPRREARHLNDAQLLQSFGLARDCRSYDTQSSSSSGVAFFKCRESPCCRGESAGPRRPRSDAGLEKR